jgi:DNA-binding beta-propeller fold protein YncE
MKRWNPWLRCVVVLCLCVAGCKSNSSSGSSAPAVTLNITSTTVSVGGSVQFEAAIVNSTNQTVTWEVNGVTGGNSTLGTIDSTGLYIAPATVPSPNAVTITAVSTADTSATATATVTIDSGIRVAVSPLSALLGTSESFQFTATVSGSSNQAVTWEVNSEVGGDSTVGTITAQGLYKAPTSAPTSGSILVQAVSQADTSQNSSSTVTVQTASDPTVTSISPSHVGQGSLFVDAYITGTNFLSTSTALVNGVAVPTTFLSVGTIRGSVPATLLSASPTTLTFQVERQGGNPISCVNVPSCQLTIDAVRPAIVATSPDSSIQNGPVTEFNIDGGFFGTASSTPSVTAQFDGHVEAILNANPRQLDVTIPTTDLAQAGLHQVSVINSNVTTPVGAPADEALTNFAVQSLPSSASIVSASLTQPGILAPIAVAINTATGIAVVVNHGSNNLTLIDLTGATPSVVPGGPIPVGNGPTSVAVDSVRNIAIVTNNLDNTLSVVNLATHAVTTVSANVQTAPYGVGVNPQTGMGVVAYQSTNIGTLLDVTQNPPAIVGAVSMSTGKTPQVAIEPRLNWGLITPGGSGIFSIVDLSRRSSNSIAATAGAVRVSSTSIVTITTTATVGLGAGDAVLVTGVADNSFNGVFTVTSVPNSNSFTFTQSGADATSGGGMIQYSEPLATVSFGLNVTGISVNPETKTALLTDSTSSSAILMSILNQSITSVPIDIGAVASGFNQYTNVGLIINPTVAPAPGGSIACTAPCASLIDPVTPTRNGAISLPGMNPVAVAIDSGSDLAVIANSGSNDVTVVSLGPIKPLELDQIVLSPTRQVNPDITQTSSSNLPLTLIGKGFQSGAVARIDGITLSPVGPLTDREMNVVVPGSLLTAPRRFSVDIQNPGNSLSNAEGFSVVQFVDLSSTTCALPAPSAVAVDDDLNIAVVAESACSSADIVDLNTGNITNTITVGADPQGVAVESASGNVAVTNRGDDTTSVFNLGTLSTAPIPVSVAGEPIGVDINPDDQTVAVANFNSNSNSVSLFTAPTSVLVASAPTTVPTGGTGPFAVAIDPYDNLLLVANAGNGLLTVFDIGLPSSPGVVLTTTGPTQPTGVVFDPVTKLFIVASSLSNSVFFVDTTNQQITSARVGINPGAIALNYLTSTLVTANTASSTISVMDIITKNVSANLGIPGANLVGIAINKERNLAVVVDQANNRLLLVPLPK